MLRKSRLLASFFVRNYRYFFVGALISNVGTWVQRVGQDWLVLTELTDGSAAALGIVTALQFLAVPILAPYAGALADRLPKRRLLMITQALLALTAFALWALVATDLVELWHVYAFAFAQGVITAFDNPARQSFVSEIVPPRLLPNAVGLNSTSFNGARLVGPGAAGVTIAALGVGPALLFNAISFLPMLVALALMRASELHPAPRARSKGATKDGLKYLAGRPDLVVVLVIVFMLGTFGMNFQIYNATMATQAFGKGATEYGMLGTIMAVGTLAGALLAARRAKPSFRTLMISLFGFSVSTMLLTFSPNYTMYSIFLVPAGFFALTVMTTANASVQLATAPEFRGRVMAIYVAIFVGGTPLGAPIIGWIGELWGPRASIAIGGVATGLTFVAVMVHLMVHDGVRLKIERGWPLRLRAWKAAREQQLDAQAVEAAT